MTLRYMTREAARRFGYITRDKKEGRYVPWSAHTAGENVTWHRVSTWVLSPLYSAARRGACETC